MSAMPMPYSWQARARQVGIYLLMALALVFLYLVYMAGNFKGLTDPNALDYAQIARNLATGQGFTTNFVKPLSLTRSLRVTRHPDLTYPPLHPWIISLFMRMVGPTQRAAALACGTAFLLTVPLIFILATWFFDYRTAWLASGLFVVGVSTIGYSTSGLEVNLLSLLVTGLIMVLYQYGQSQQHRVPLVAGSAALVGLVYLTKYVWTVAIIPVLIYVYFSTPRRQRSRMVLIFIIVFFIVIAPWCYRMYVVSGNPFFTWRWYETTMDTRTHPGNTLYRSFPEHLTTLPTYIILHPMEVYEKARAGMASLYPILAALGGYYITSLFLVAILVPLGSRNFERVRYLIYGIYGMVFAALVVVLPSARLLYPLAPVVIVIASGCYFRIFRPLVADMGPREQTRYTAVAIAALLILQAFPLALSLTRRDRPGEEPTQQTLQRWSKEAADLAEAGPIITDIPWLMAWHADVPAIWLPHTVEDLARMQQAVGQIQWLLLTPTVSRTQATERTGQWVEAWRQALVRDIPPFHGFVVHERLGDGSWILYHKVARASSMPTE